MDAKRNALKKMAKVSTNRSIGYTISDHKGNTLKRGLEIKSANKGTKFSRSFGVEKGKPSVRFKGHEVNN